MPYGPKLTSKKFGEMAFLIDCATLLNIVVRPQNYQKVVTFEILGPESRNCIKRFVRSIFTLLIREHFSRSKLEKKLFTKVKF